MNIWKINFSSEIFLIYFKCWPLKVHSLTIIMALFTFSFILGRWWILFAINFSGVVNFYVDQNQKLNAKYCSSHDVGNAKKPINCGIVKNSPKRFECRCNGLDMKNANKIHFNDKWIFKILIIPLDSCPSKTSKTSRTTKKMNITPIW